MPIITAPSGPLDANSHLYHNGKDAIIIDPLDEIEEIKSFLSSNNLTLQAILLTHLHFDHAYGCADAQKAYNLPVYVGKEDIKIADELLSSVRFGMPKVPTFKMEELEEGTQQFGSITCQVLHCPGHSPGSLVYYIQEEKAVFTGDVLFYRSIGRSDLPGGNFKILEKSIQDKIYSLPDETTVYCGHGPETSVGDEKRQNAFVQAKIL